MRFKYLKSLLAKKDKKEGVNLVEKKGSDEETVGLEKEQNDYVKKAKGFYASVQGHLNSDYRKQYNLRRFISCFLLFLLLWSWSGNWFISIDSMILMIHTYPMMFWKWLGSLIIPLIWSVSAWIFWHYSFWSYQGGAIDTFSRHIIYIGSIWSLIWRLVVQNIVLLTWIAFIAPFSGVKTWRKAVEHNKVLFVGNNQKDVWD